MADILDEMVAVFSLPSGTSEKTERKEALGVGGGKYFAWLGAKIATYCMSKNSSNFFFIYWIYYENCTIHLLYAVVYWIELIAY